MGKNKEGSDFIVLGFDPLFKKMFGDIYDTDKAAAVVSIFLDIPYKDVKGNIYVYNNEKKILNKDDKRQEVDVLLHVILKSGNQYVNLEANLFNYSQDLVNRNVGYLSNVFSNQLDKCEDYSLLEPVLQVNFSVPDKEHKSDNPDDVIDEYLLRNDRGEILTTKERILNIDIEKCYCLWYNKDIKKFNPRLQTIIKLGALHYIRNEDEFRKCLGEIDMDNEVKTKIQSDMDEYQKDKSLAMAYDYEKHINSLRRTKDRELEEKEKRINDYEQEVKNHEQEVKNHEQEVKNHEQEVKNHEQEVKNHEQEVKNHEQEVKNHEQEVKNHEQEVKDYEQEVSDREKKINDYELRLSEHEKKVKKSEDEVNEREEKLIQEKINIVKNLLSINMSYEEISKLTNLTIDEIKKIGS